MQVLPVRGTSDLDPFFLVAKWELLLLTGNGNRSWKQNHEEVLHVFELIFPFTLCLFLCFILWKYFYYTSLSVLTFTTPLPSSLNIIQYCTLGEKDFVKYQPQSDLESSDFFCLVQYSHSYWSRNVRIRLIVPTEA